MINKNKKIVCENVFEKKKKLKGKATPAQNNFKSKKEMIRNDDMKKNVTNWLVKKN